MEIKIGIRQSSRELSIETDKSVQDITQAVKDALDNDSVLSFTDIKGRSVIVPTTALAYVETSTATSHRVGFGIN